MENEWHDVAKVKPVLHQQVLVELKDGPGQVCDVACYVGKQPTGEDRWILADINLDSRQIVRWAYIYPKPPRDEITKAIEAFIKEHQIVIERK